MAFPAETSEMDLSMGTVPNPSGVGKETRSINDLIVCTYDESHVVSGGRYIAHLLECAKANNNQKSGETPTTSAVMEKCKFDSSHHVLKSLMTKHLQLCDAYYKYCMEHQEDPISMREVYKRYEAPAPPVKKSDDASNSGSETSSVFEDSTANCFQLSGFMSDIPESLSGVVLSEMEG